MKRKLGTCFVVTSLTHHHHIPAPTVAWGTLLPTHYQSWHAKSSTSSHQGVLSCMNDCMDVCKLNDAEWNMTGRMAKSVLHLPLSLPLQPHSMNNYSHTFNRTLTQMNEWVSPKLQWRLYSMTKLTAAANIQKYFLCVRDCPSEQTHLFTDTTGRST